MHSEPICQGPWAGFLEDTREVNRVRLIRNQSMALKSTMGPLPCTTCQAQLAYQSLEAKTVVHY